MTEVQDKDLSALGDTFKQLVTHMKGGFPVWEEFVTRGLRFQKQLEHTVASLNSFLEGFNRVTELCIHAKGSSKELGVGLANLMMWHRGHELKMRELNQTLMNKMLTPLQVKVEEWKRTTTHLDREHDKEVQRSMREIKESFKTTMKAKSKLKKDKPPEKAAALRNQYEHQQQECDRRFHDAEEKERRFLSRLLLEERKWFCGFANAFSRVMDIKVTMLGDIEPLKGILDDLASATSQPDILPDHAKDFVESWAIPSPSSRKRTSSSTMVNTITPAPSMISVNSNSSGDSTGPTPVAPPLPPDISSAQRQLSTGSLPSSQYPTSGPPAPPAPVPPPVPSITGAGQQHPTTNSAFTPQYAPSGPVPIPPPVPHNAGATQQQPWTTPPPNPIAPPVPLNFGASQQWNGTNSLPASQYASTIYATPNLPNHVASTAYATPTPPNHVTYSSHSNLPPPPPANFPPTSMDAYASHPRVSPQLSYPMAVNQMQGYGSEYAMPTYNGQAIQRPLSSVSHEEQYEPASPPTNVMSGSPSQTSLMSTLSSESSRSLSPPVGPSRSPAVSRTHLSSLQEEEPVQPAPTNFQQALANKLRQRAQTLEGTAPPSASENRPVIQRTPSIGSRPGPPVTAKKSKPPPRVAHKPQKQSSVDEYAAPAVNGTYSQNYAYPHHVLQPDRISSQRESSSSDEDESAFAKALKQKKLRKASQIDDRSNVRMNY